MYFCKAYNETSSVAAAFCSLTFKTGVKRVVKVRKDMGHKLVPEVFPTFISTLKSTISREKETTGTKGNVEISPSRNQPRTDPTAD